MLFLPGLMGRTSLFVICVQTIDLDYHYTKVIRHGEEHWQLLDEMVARAERYWEELPPEERDFDKAKAAFMRRFL